MLCPDALLTDFEAWQEAHYHRASYPFLHFRPLVIGRSWCHAPRQGCKLHRLTSPVELLFRPHLISSGQSWPQSSPHHPQWSHGQLHQLDIHKESSYHSCHLAEHPIQIRGPCHRNKRWFRRHKRLSGTNSWAAASDSRAIQRLFGSNGVYTKRGDG